MHPNFEKDDAPKIANEMIEDMIRFNGVGLAPNVKSDIMVGYL